MSTKQRSTFSVIVPVYNEEETIQEFYNRLKKTLEKDFSHFNHEIIYVDDGSSDGSYKMLEALSNKDPIVNVISFSRNFGHHIAVTAGLDHATGDYVVMMDGDLQDQPEEIIKLFAKLQEGYDVVAGERINKKFSFFKRTSSRLFVWIIRSLTDKRIIINNTIFRIVTKQVVVEIKKLREMHRYLVGVIGWVGFKHTTTPVEHGKRYAGTSKYTIKKQLKLAFDAIVSFSDRFLHVISCLGFFLVIISAILICITVYKKIYYGIPVLGWASLLTTILFIGGVQIIILGVLGEYIGRTYMEAKHRPLYVIRTYIKKNKELFNEYTE